MKQFYSLCTIKTNNSLLKKFLFLCLIMFALGSVLIPIQAQDISKVYQHWSDVPPLSVANWTNGALNANASDYFEGEVVPHVYFYQASNSVPLVNNQSYSFNIIYNYWESNSNAGGFGYITDYNLSRTPILNVSPVPVIDNTPIVGSQGHFYTIYADITATAFVPPVPVIGSTDRMVAVTFSYTGPTTTSGYAAIFFGLYIAPPGFIPDQGKGATVGASNWKGASLQTTINIGGSGATSLGINPAGIISGTISGVKFNDLDQDGTKDPLEPGLNGWTINNGSASDVTHTFNTVDGYYSFSVIPGTYTISEVNQAGWIASTPTGGTGSVTVTTAAPNQTLNFGNYQAAPALSIVKTATPATYDAVGAVIGYSYLVTNTGNTTLYNITVSDDKATVTCPSTALGLAPLGTITCTASYTITQGDLDAGSVKNTAYATDGTTKSPNDDETVNAIQNPALMITKTSSPSAVTEAGQVVTYTFLVENTGNVTLTNVVVTDPMFQSLVCGPVTLVPGGKNSCTATYTVLDSDIENGSIYNVATATGKDTNDNPVTDTDDNTVNVTRFACTYTQGWYGNPGGKNCAYINGAYIQTDALTMMQNSISAMSDADNDGYKDYVFGRSGNSFKLDERSIISAGAISNVPVYNRIFALLPGGGTPGPLKGINSSLDNTTSKWAGVPRSTKKSTYGKIMNNLLAQTITLWFNMQNDADLSDLTIQERFIITQDNVECGVNIPVAGTSTFTEIPLKVFNYLGKGFTITELFELANDVLGGLIPKNTLSPSDVDKAIDAINRGFDGCRVLERFSATNPSLEGINPAPLTATKSDEAIAYDGVPVQREIAAATVTVYPNPFATVVKFEIGMNIDSHVRLEIYSTSGVLLRVILDEDLIMGDVRTVQFDATRYPHSSFLYVLKTQFTIQSGTIMKTK